MSKIKPGQGKQSQFKPALLDVNVLIALIDSDHRFHDAAHIWFAQCSARKRKWCTCPITENGCIRVLSKPGYPYPGLTADKIREVLAGMTAAPNHEFVADSVSLLDRARFLLTGSGPGHLTDIYLAGLAAANGMRLVTFDQGIRVAAVTGAGSDLIELISDAPDSGVVN